MPIESTPQLVILDQHNPDITGTKGLVLIGDKVLVYRRDAQTSEYPLMLDLPGGKQEAGETPFETFRRETQEEFGITISRTDMTYVRLYERTTTPGTYACFPVAQLPASAANSIRFGDEGISYAVMSMTDYLSATDAWPVLQTRTKDYLQSLGSSAE